MTEFNNINNDEFYIPKEFKLNIPGTASVSYYYPEEKVEIIPLIQDGAYQSERANEINPGYGPDVKVHITSSKQIVFVSSQKYGSSSWERTSEPDWNHGARGGTREGNEWETEVFFAEGKGTVESILRKLESGEIKVVQKTLFYYDTQMNSFYCVPQHETEESRDLKGKTIAAFQKELNLMEIRGVIVSAANFITFINEIEI